MRFSVGESFFFDDVDFLRGGVWRRHVQNQIIIMNIPSSKLELSSNLKVILGSFKKQEISKLYNNMVQKIKDG